MKHKKRKSKKKPKLFKKHIKQKRKAWKRKTVIEKWRGKDRIKLTWKTNGALATEKVKERLVKLMGTDVIRLNDKNYIDKMIDRLEEERQLEVEKREQALAEAEKERVRKLELEGIIPKTKEEKTFKGYRKRRTKRHDSPKEKTHDKLEEHVEQSDNEDAQTNESSECQDVVTQVEIIDSSTKKTENPTDGLEETDSGDNNDSKSTPNRKGSEKHTHFTDERPRNDKITKEEEDKIRTSKPKSVYTGKFARKESPFIKRLRETENVDELYYIAEQIMSPVENDKV